MKRDFLDKLAEASYEARCTELVKGIYPESVQRIPSSLQFYHWEDLQHITQEDAVKWLYRKQAESTIQAFFAEVILHGSVAAKQAMEVIMDEMGSTMFTDKERAQMEWDKEERKS